jgi:hypothetical protein
MTLGLDCRCFPFPLAVRVLDLVFFERSPAPLFRVVMALLKRNARHLLAIDETTALMEALRDLPHKVASRRIESHLNRDSLARTRTRTLPECCTFTSFAPCDR